MSAIRYRSPSQGPRGSAGDSGASLTIDYVDLIERSVAIALKEHKFRLLAAIEGIDLNLPRISGGYSRAERTGKEIRNSALQVVLEVFDNV